jgi:UDP-N-acetyl-D-mannosaminuronic acid dehydrogenase
MMKIAIFGIGRVGLPLALSFADKGCKVIGVDIDSKKIAMLNEGEMPFIEEGAEHLLKKYVKKSFVLTTEVEFALKNSDAIILTLGTPVDEHMNPVYKQIEEVMANMLPHLRNDHLIILRSTVSPGTTEYMKRFIEKHTSFKVGKNIFLGFCPERIAEGKSIEEIPQIPQIIGTLDEKSSLRCEEVFKTIVNKCLKTDARSAELSKLFCNMYRYIDFAIANEFMMIAEAHERDIYEIANLVNFEYKRKGLKQPGFAAGPCLYKDGFFLVNKTPYTELISTSWKVNETTPAFLIELIKKKAKIQGKKVVILGLGFKKNIDDTRNSLSFKAKKIFLAEGAEVHTHDPYIESKKIEEVLVGADIVMMAVNHDYYKELGLEKIKKYVKHDCIICDIWNMFETGKIIFNVQ